MTVNLPELVSRVTDPFKGGRWQAHSHEKLRRLALRWGFALAGFVMGLVCMGWGYSDMAQSLWQTEEALDDLRGKVQTLQAQVLSGKQSADASRPMPASLALLPTRNQQALIWPRLQQLLAQYDLRLISLRPVPDPFAAPLVSQAVALHLQGRFDDWVDVWADMGAIGPVWSIERLRITPRDGGIDLEAVLRVWLGDVSADGASGGWEGMVKWPVRDRTRLAAGFAGADKVFSNASFSAALKPVVSVQQPETLPAQMAPALLANPHDWPLSQLRLAGIWQEAQERQVILLAGPHWVRARQGERVTREGHRVERIDDDRVSLRAAQGALQVLTFAKVPP